MKKLSLAIAVSMATISTGAFAAGFQLNEHSAAGLGRAFAGEGAIADNAAVVARNPAAMTMFSEMTVSGGLTYINPEVDVQATSYYTGAPVTGTQYDAAPTAFVPNGYLIMPINDKMAFGLALNSNYGLSTDYDDDFVARLNAGTTGITTVQINPNFAYQVTDKLSLGVGVSFVYGDAEFNVSDPVDGHQMVVGVNPISGAPIQAQDGFELMGMEGDGFDYGWNIGALYQFTDHTRLGLTYRSGVDMNLEGDVESDILPTVGAGSLNLNLPAIAEASFYHSFGKFGVSASYMWIQWSEFQDLVAEFDNPALPGLPIAKNDWNDSSRYSIGAEYELNTSWKLRAGIAYDESPVPAANRNLPIPDSDRMWYTAGATYSVSEKTSVDFGFGYIKGDSVKIGEYYANDDFGPTTGEIERGDAFLYSVSFNHTFK